MKKENLIAALVTMTITLLVFAIVNTDTVVDEEVIEVEIEENKTQFETYVGGSTLEEVRHNQNTSNINDLEE